MMQSTPEQSRADTILLWSTVAVLTLAILATCGWILVKHSSTSSFESLPAATPAVAQLRPNQTREAQAEIKTIQTENQVVRSRVQRPSGSVASEASTAKRQSPPLSEKTSSKAKYSPPSVLVPGIKKSPGYPQSHLSTRPVRIIKQTTSALEESVPVNDVPDKATLATPRARPHFELPRLQLPDEQSYPGSTGLPGYQSKTNGSVLPGYNTSSRTRDTVPGY